MELETDKIVTFKTDPTKEEIEAFAKERMRPYKPLPGLQVTSVSFTDREDADGYVVLQCMPARAKSTFYPSPGKTYEYRTLDAEDLPKLFVQPEDKDYLADEEDFYKYFRDRESD